MKRGRPPKPVKNRLSRSLSLVVNLEELTLLQSRAKESRMSMSQFLRSRLGLRELGYAVCMTTYLILDEHNRVKIGIAVDVKRRLAALQSANPERLTVVFEIPGNHELAFKSRFSTVRLRGEWYTWTEEIGNYAHSLLEKSLTSRTNPETSTVRLV